MKGLIVSYTGVWYWLFVSFGYVLGIGRVVSVEKSVVEG